MDTPGHDTWPPYTVLSVFSSLPPFFSFFSYVPRYVKDTRLLLSLASSFLGYVREMDEARDIFLFVPGLTSFIYLLVSVCPSSSYALRYERLYLSLAVIPGILEDLTSPVGLEVYFYLQRIYGMSDNPANRRIFYVLFILFLFFFFANTLSFLLCYFFRSQQTESTQLFMRL